MCAFKYFTKIDLVHEACYAQVQRWWPGGKLKHAWQLTSGLCFYRPSTVGHLQAVQVWTVVEVASGRASHAWHERHSNAGNGQAQGLIIGCPSWRNVWHMWYLHGYLGWGISYLGVLKFDYKLSDKSCYMPWQPEHFQSPPVNGKWMCM